MSEHARRNRLGYLRGILFGAQAGGPFCARRGVWIHRVEDSSVSTPSRRTPPYYQNFPSLLLIGWSSQSG